VYNSADPLASRFAGLSPARKVPFAAAGSPGEVAFVRGERALWRDGEE